MPRVAPITGKADVPAEYHEVVDGVLQVFGQIRGPFSMLLHSPKIAERMLSFVRFFRTDCVVETILELRDYCEQMDIEAVDYGLEAVAHARRQIE